MSHVYALDLATHMLKWHWQQESMGISSHPVIIGENIYFTTGRGGVYALRESDGTELWHILPEHVFPSGLLVG
jgi:outer membrane protein assembly factor BamB